MEHMLDVSRTRRQVVNQLVNMGVVEDRKMLRKKRKKGERKWKKDDGFVVVSKWLLLEFHLVLCESSDSTDTCVGKTKFHLQPDFQAMKKNTCYLTRPGDLIFSIRRTDCCFLQDDDNEDEESAGIKHYVSG